jgi:hypothetical protein
MRSCPVGASVGSGEQRTGVVERSVCSIGRRASLRETRACHAEARTVDREMSARLDGPCACIAEMKTLLDDERSRRGERRARLVQERACLAHAGGPLLEQSALVVVKRPWVIAMRVCHAVASTLHEGGMVRFPIHSR